MESLVKKQTINTVHVFTKNNQVYVKKGQYQHHPVPLRWIPVLIPK
ncbi:MAG: hypothetical protein AAGC45_03985 [Bacteroidota bacterium]